jgi:hypothetical protein
VLGVAPNIPGFLHAAFPASFPDVGAAFRPFIPTRGSSACSFRASSTG